MTTWACKSCRKSASAASLCADKLCPAVPGSVHCQRWALPAPSATSASEEEILAAFRRTRVDMRRRIELSRGQWG